MDSLFTDVFFVWERVLMLVFNIWNKGAGKVPGILDFHFCGACAGPGAKSASDIR